MTGTIKLPNKGTDMGPHRDTENEQGWGVGWARNKPKHMRSTKVSQACQEHTMETGHSLQRAELGELDRPIYKNENGPLFYGTHKN